MLVAAFLAGTYFASILITLVGASYQNGYCAAKGGTYLAGESECQLHDGTIIRIDK